MFVSGVPVIRGTTRANHGMSVPSKHTKERLCTLTSHQGPRAGWGWFFPLTLFLTKVNRAFPLEDTPVVIGRGLLAEGSPWLPKGGLPSGQARELALGGHGGDRSTHWFSFIRSCFPFNQTPESTGLGVRRTWAQVLTPWLTPSMTLGKSLVSL